MNTIRAIVRDGRIETEAPLDLPDGTEVLISEASGPEYGDGWEDSPERIEAWVKWCDSLEPLVFTEGEKAAREADRQARKDWEKAQFDEYTDRLARMWE